MKKKNVSFLPEAKQHLMQPVAVDLYDEAVKKFHLTEYQAGILSLFKYKLNAFFQRPNISKSEFKFLSNQFRSGQLTPKMIEEYYATLSADEKADIKMQANMKK